MASPYYRFGGQIYPYQANWQGRPWQNTRAAETRSLGDVTEPGFMVIPPKDDPYLLHKQNYQRAPEFRVPESVDPYYLHKAQQYELEAGLGPTGGILDLSRSEKQAAIVVGAAAAAWFLFFRKGAPARSLLRGRK